MFSSLLYISGFNQTHLWRQSRHDWLFVYILANDMTSFIQPLTYSTRSSKQQNSRHTIKDITYTILNNTENWITLTSIKTRGIIRCPIANTRVNHSKKAKLNIMHVTEFFGTFFSDRQNIFRSDKIFNICIGVFSQFQLHTRYCTKLPWRAPTPVRLVKEWILILLIEKNN